MFGIRCVSGSWSSPRCSVAPAALKDRKSTRLNSSHSKISYAVFCLKKKDPYQQRVAEVGKFDVIHLGMGPCGHTASLFPDSAALEADPCRLVVMNEDPHARNPYDRMTFTFSAISRGRLVIVTVEGEEKREALARVRAG